ncbi:DUF3667 domain-containing protein [Marilutibacter spongiae]|uniref:DUF3667 domain-containing protein n=1 Tax=Marilutibacter spongiae TaxID=2025720 RepID=A0A7W3TMZ1_9GAMM|nr:DUF3667 domain-containing protein [Lysobacter spongiae]MBB1061310.1 DUF3667 domain-containing protein [Lysobacter spongiae]
MTDIPVASPATEAPETSPHGHCENCDAVLHGHYCHDCGQSTHSPVRHVGHAIEEVFESFWHLDGRVFRTLRDLMVPGRAALEYLAGHRARYIPPLRMFVILSVLTFFIGRIMIHIEDEPVVVDAGKESVALAKLDTVEAVEKRRDEMLAEIRKAREEAAADGAALPGVDVVLITAETRIRGEAANRIGQLQRAERRARAKAGAAGDAPPAEAGAPNGAEAATTPAADPATPADAAAATATADAGATEDADAGEDGEFDGPLFAADSEAWKVDENTVNIKSLPAPANAWLNRKFAHMVANFERLEGRPDLYLQAFLGSVPSALFVLVPLFALLLKVAYLFKRRLYLEHLAIALYSHCFLLVSLTVMFLLIGLGDAVATSLPWLSTLTGIAWVLILLWMPVYLLLMQKRVYGQGWPMTLLKYLVIGSIYFWMLTLTATFMFLATMAKTV